MLCSTRSHRSEKPVQRNQESSPQLEKACGHKRRPSGAKNKVSKQTLIKKKDSSEPGRRSPGEAFSFSTTFMPFFHQEVQSPRAKGPAAEASYSGWPVPKPLCPQVLVTSTVCTLCLGVATLTNIKPRDLHCPTHLLWSTFVNSPCIKSSQFIQFMCAICFLS